MAYIKRLPHHVGGRIYNGGARKGAGRPRIPINPEVLDYAWEKVPVRELRDGQIRYVKKPRVIIALDALFHI